MTADRRAVQLQQSGTGDEALRCITEYPHGKTGIVQWQRSNPNCYVQPFGHHIHSAVHADQLNFDVGIVQREVHQNRSYMGV